MKHPFPSESEVDDLYRSSWEEPAQNTSETGSTPAELADVLAECLESEIQRSLAGLRLLDFGAGRGAFSRALASRGAEVTVYEPYGAELLIRGGIHAISNREAISESFDGIAATEVIEHLRDPLEFGSWLHDHLNPLGWAFITTPNVEGFNARLRRQRWREFEKPGHVSLFSMKSITTALAAAGFTSIRSLKWNIGTGSLLRRASETATSAIGLHGALRVLARRG